MDCGQKPRQSLPALARQSHSELWFLSHCRPRLPKSHGGHTAGSTPSHRAQQYVLTSHDVITILHRKESCVLHGAKLDVLQ